MYPGNFADILYGHLLESLLLAAAVAVEALAGLAGDARLAALPARPRVRHL